MNWVIQPGERDAREELYSLRASEGIIAMMERDFSQRCIVKKPTVTSCDNRSLINHNE